MSDDVAERAGGFDRKREVEALWEADETWTGQIYRQVKSGMTVKEIAAESSVTRGPVYGNISLINALIEGTVSPHPTVARGWAGRVRTWLKNKDLSSALRAALEEQEAALNAVADTAPAHDQEATVRDGTSPRMWGIHNDTFSGADLVNGGFVSIGWDGLGDLSLIGPDQSALKAALEAANPGEKSGAYPNWAGTLRRFAFGMQLGDVVVAPDGDDRTLNFGRVLSGYEFHAEEPTHRHRRQVEWLATVSRDDVSQQARNELGSAITLFEIRRSAKELAEIVRKATIAANAKEFADRQTADDIRRAALDSDSLFTPGVAVWTIDHADELAAQYVNAPDISAGSFDEKLDAQMAAVSDGAKQLFAELWYLNLLPLADYAPATKRKLINGFLARMTTPATLPDALDEALETAAFNGGVAFKTRRWAQLALLVRIAASLLRLKPAERETALGDPKAFADFLDTVTEPREPAQRHALKFVMFPGYYLPIVSKAHRAAIVNAFLDRLNGEVGRDTDETLHLIAQTLRDEHGDDVELYVPPLLDVWDPDREFVRNPDLAKPEATRRAWLVKPASEGQAGRWLTGSHVGLDATYLGPVDPSIGPEDLAAAVDVGYAHLSEAARAERAEDFEAFLTRVTAGDLVVSVIAGVLRFGEIEGAAKHVTPDEGHAELRRATTWSDTTVTLDQVPREIAARLSTDHDLLDLTAFVEILEGLDDRTETLTGKSAAALTLPDGTDELAGRLHVPRAWVQEVIDLLRDRPQLIFYGPPGTGKTYLARKVAEHLTGDISRVKLVQFHPAYSYEDFFEGYRPTDSGTFALKRGPMRRVVDLAREHPHTPYVLIIDEINRGNLAKVFGELYFLLEYREETVNLMYGGDDKGFTLPENVFIIGTMNTADRSIALVDAAMRRRFAFLPLHPSEEPTSGILRRWLAAQGHGSESAELLDALNARIDDPDFKIGPSYLMRPAVHTDGGLERTWRTAILPALEEHHFGDGTDVVARYGLAAIRRANTPLPAATPVPLGPEALKHDQNAESEG